MAEYTVAAPLDDDMIEKLEAGDLVFLNGTIYTGRDAAHKKLFELIQEGKELPVDLTGQIIYYVGPSPARPGQVIGSAGPTTSGRMDAYTPALLDLGLKGMIGKGLRSREVLDSIKKNRAIYFAATGGAAALISKRIIKSEVVAYPELGPEAIYRLEVENFPVIVVNDTHGGDMYNMGRQQYQGE
ncbi:Fe-S-containing hydro-lyase [Phosphitispora fastidiosa]|uniref:Fe-S-containing hydro-lyase n=1 Tax=Phosphitispora fastidiosa TaxID=2837202 RepID=UPI001E3E07F3|nr:Fe-S-containing hydro-lyase [Phosphitispora fastidiosa]MBU7007614.1 fumarate hydratase subunit beta [Phosphitispora fastidiosa]